MKEKQKLFKLVYDVAEHLGVDQLPVEFAPIGLDDSKLIISPKAKIVINSKFEDDFIECAKCITHELRHVYQIYYTQFINDNLSRVWKNEIADAKNSNSFINTQANANYKLQAIEVDAFAFTQVYLKKLNVVVKDPDARYQNMIDQYIKKYF